MLKTRYQRLIAITLFLDFAVSLGCGLQFAMIGGEGEMPMYYLNANLISLYIQPGLTVMAAVQILSFRSVRPLLAPRGKMDYFDQRLAQLLLSTVPYLFGKNPCFRYGPAWKGTLLALDALPAVHCLFHADLALHQDQISFLYHCFCQHSTYSLPLLAGEDLAFTEIR